MGATPLAAGDLAELKPYGFQSSTPLWYYVLKEAQQVADGLHLGPVGGRIVAEVLIGLLETDSNSYLAAEAEVDANPCIGRHLVSDEGLLCLRRRRPDESRPVAPALPIADGHS